MQINWKKAESRIEPALIDATSSIDGVYIRQNIESEIRLDNDNKEYTIFVYDEAFLTPDEYARYSLIEDVAEKVSLKHENDIIDAYTLQLIEGGIL